MKQVQRNGILIDMKQVQCNDTLIAMEQQKYRWVLDSFAVCRYILPSNMIPYRLVCLVLKDVRVDYFGPRDLEYILSKHKIAYHKIIPWNSHATEIHSKMWSIVWHECICFLKFVYIRQNVFSSYRSNSRNYYFMFMHLTSFLISLRL